MGAIPIQLTCQQHDYVTAAISHVPHLVAAALANLVHDHDSADETMKLIAAGGFKDITRIASSSPDMWESICMSNTENIANLLDDYIISLQTISKAMRAKQTGFTYDLFAASKEYRDSFSDLPRGPHITKVLPAMWIFLTKLAPSPPSPHCSPSLGFQSKILASYIIGILRRASFGLNFMNSLL